MDGMRRRPEALTEREYDCVIVGGGVCGMSLAWEAASRGLTAALVERGDFCHAASANSLKVVHGGIRYLQHGDLYRIRESSEERSSLLRIAPHLVRPMPIVVPTYRGLLRGRTAMRAALVLYDLLTFDRNRGIRDPRNRVPRGRLLSRQACVELFPDLDQPELTGAALFHDGQMYNPTRLALAFLRSALAAGAAAANYVEARGYLRRGDRVVGIRARDLIAGSDLEIRGRVVLNAVGGWTPGLLESLALSRPTRPSFSRDACFIVPRRLTGDHALAVQGATSDPDALLSRGARHLFLVPWRDCTLVGVWHVVYEGDPDRYAVSAEELQGWLDEVNAALPSLRLRLDDVSLWNAGLVLFGRNEPGARDLSYGKRSLIVDHERRDGLGGLITVIGVRYTTARGVAARAVDLALRRLGLGARPSATDRTALFGGDYESFDVLAREVASREGFRPAEACVVPLLRNYGSRYADVLRYADDEPGLGRALDRSTTLEAEVLHAVREEMALKLSDVVFRRTDLGTGAYPGDAAVERCAARMAAEFGWDAVRVGSEIAEVRSRFLRLS